MKWIVESYLVQPALSSSFQNATNLQITEKKKTRKERKERNAVIAYCNLVGKAETLLLANVVFEFLSVRLG